MGRPRKDAENSDVDVAELKANPKTAEAITQDEVDALAPGYVKATLAWIDEPEYNPKPGRPGQPIPVGINGSIRYYPPGVPVILTETEAEVLERTKRFSVSRMY